MKKTEIMNVLLLGSGGREHALSWKLSQSEYCDKLFIAPGNGGTRECGTNIPVAADDFERITTVVLENQIKLVVVGPEDPLVKGIVDFFKSNDRLKEVNIIGPSAKGAQLEGSKAFSKQFMHKHHIPTASYKEFTRESIEEGYKYIDSLETPIVLKADGLAAGKGVLICSSHDEAKSLLKEMIVQTKFGTASEKVVIEDFLDGIEFSVFVLTDGKTYKLLPTAKDYKRIGKGDAGLNTGGMGAVSPVPFADSELMRKVENNVVKPTIEGLRAENIGYNGFLYFGLMNVAGEPYVIEYNARLGDPETQVVIPRIKNDLVEMFMATNDGSLGDLEVWIDERACTSVVLASAGYPGEYEKGKVIEGIEEVTGSMVFHAGTKYDHEHLLTNGGRVLAVSSFGKDFKEALTRSYESIKKIRFEGKYYRDDIGFDL